MYEIFYSISFLFRGASSDQGNQHEAFREWFAHIGELRAIRPDVPITALTATSAPLLRRKIMKSLCFKQSAVIISESPDRANIKISAMSVPNNSEIEDNLSWLLEDLKTQGEKLPRHIIFSESISDVSKIYAIFRKRFRTHETYEMFHSKTASSKKELIRSDMAKDGKIRVLICTNSAGMGVNYFGVNNIVHYGLPREMDTLVQQMGRAGRDGSSSHEIIIYKYHKGHLKQTEEELVRMVKDNKCRREVLCTSYATKCTNINPRHLCCDVCEKICECKTIGCPQTHPALQHDATASLNTDDTTSTMSREVQESDRILLSQKLEFLQYKLSDFSSVVRSDLTHGLSDDVISYIVNHAQVLFTPEDILRSCPIWSYDVSAQISAVINDTFGDSAMYEVVDQDDSEIDDTDNVDY